MFNQVFHKIGFTVFLRIPVYSPSIEAPGHMRNSILVSNRQWLIMRDTAVLLVSNRQWLIMSDTAVILVSNRQQLIMSHHLLNMVVGGLL